MVIHHGVELNQPFSRVERALLEGPEGWLPSLLEITHDHVVTRLFLEMRRLSVSREIVVKLGPPQRGPRWLVLPVSWHARKRPELFPTLSGRIEARSHTIQTTWLTMQAVYTPPLGLLGATADRLFMKRVAEATVNDFLDRVGGVIERNAWSQVVALHPNAVAGPDD